MTDFSKWAGLNSGIWFCMGMFILDQIFHKLAKSEGSSKWIAHLFLLVSIEPTMLARTRTNYISFYYIYIIHKIYLQYSTFPFRYNNLILLWQNQLKFLEIVQILTNHILCIVELFLARIFIYFSVLKVWFVFCLYL